MNSTMAVVMNSVSNWLRKSLGNWITTFHSDQCTMIDFALRSVWSWPD